MLHTWKSLKPCSKKVYVPLDFLILRHTWRNVAHFSLKIQAVFGTCFCSTTFPSTWYQNKDHQQHHCTGCFSWHFWHHQNRKSWEPFVQFCSLRSSEKDQSRSQNLRVHKSPTSCPFNINFISIPCYVPNKLHDHHSPLQLTMLRAEKHEVLHFSLGRNLRL